MVVKRDPIKPVGKQTVEEANRRSPNQQKMDAKRAKLKKPKPATQSNPVSDADLVEGLTEAKDAAENALDAGSMEGADNFTDHYYLTAIVDELAKLNASTSFPYWTSIRQNENGRHPSYLTSYFEGWDAFLRLAPHQVTALQPYFRLSLVTRERKAARFGEISSEIPVIIQGTFEGSFSGRSVTDPSAALMENYHESMLGLKSFNWKREAGTGDKGKKAQTRATLVFFGNNLSIFEKHPYDKILARTALGYGLKVVVGWSVPPKHNNIFTARQLGAINNARDILYLQTQANTFDFNQDGTFKVELKCVGSTNDFMRDFDLLGGENQTATFVDIDGKVSEQLKGGSLQKKIDDRVKKLEANRDIEGDQLVTEAQRKNFTKDEVSQAYEEAIDKALEGSDISESDKRAYKENAIATINEESKKSYTGESPTYLSPTGLRELHKKHVVEANKKAQKQRTHDRMSRIQRILYNQNAIRILKVDKKDFQGFAAQTKTAIAGRREYLNKLSQRLDNQLSLYKSLGGTWKIDGGDTRTLERDEEGYSNSLEGWTFGMMDGDSAYVNIKGKDGSSLTAEEWLVENEMLVEHGLGNQLAGTFSGGATLTNDETDENFQKFKTETLQMQQDDPFSEETARRSALVYYREVRANEFAYDSKLFITKESDIGSSVEGRRIYSAQARNTARILEQQEKVQQELELLDKSMADGTPPPKPSVMSLYQNATEDQKKEMFVEIEGGEIKEKIDGNNPEILQNHYITYFFFGDLINALYIMAQKDNRLDLMPYIAMSSMSYVKNTSDIGRAKQKEEAAVKVVPKRTMVEMADIPISIKRFNAFFHKYYIQELVEKVSLPDFLKKVFEVLIRPIFSGEAFDLKLKRPNNDFINYTDGEMTKSSYANMVKNSRINLTAINPKAFYKPESNKSIKPYIMVTANLEHQAFGNFNYARDLELNIPHFYLGADSGIVKTVAFTAVQNAFDQTDRAIKASKVSSAGSLGVLKTPYHINMISVGNPILKLGNLFLMLPTVPGGNAYRTARNLGLGGYYRVISKEGSMSDGGTYEVAINAINENNQVEKDKTDPSKGNETETATTEKKTMTDKVTT